ncbi:hypothetical protein FF38_04129 [Lucilia cuprina]|uniref:Uncharacterized protein n=1 Tax=Lucilia cuprina TaxID=7375 RepID=A0A0L0BRT1_LUCCU|nr:hypothetical protein FF38_04129 [Lucilia cuprina]
MFTFSNALKSHLVLSLESISQQEQEELINHGIAQYIKRFEIINLNAEEKFTTELKSLKEIFEYTLNNTFVKKELAKQKLNENIRIAKFYLVHMYNDLKDLDLDNEALNLQYILESIYQIKDLREKRLMYNYVISNLSTDFQDILDHQPMHEVLLKAHLNFLLHFIVHVTLLTDAEQYDEDLALLGEQLYVTLKNDNVQEKLSFLEKFNDVSTKFGRMLQQLFIDLLNILQKKIVQFDLETRAY